MTLRTDFEIFPIGNFRDSNVKMSITDTFRPRWVMDEEPTKAKFPFQSTKYFNFSLRSVMWIEFAHIFVRNQKILSENRSKFVDSEGWMYVAPVDHLFIKSNWESVRFYFAPFPSIFWCVSLRGRILLKSAHLHFRLYFSCSW